MKNALRFPNLNNKTRKGKISAYEQNWKKAIKAAEAGQIICLSDLMIQAEDIHLTTLENSARREKEVQKKRL